MTGSIIPMRGRMTNRRQSRRAATGAQRRALKRWMQSLTLGELSERYSRYGNPLVIHGGRV